MFNVIDTTSIKLSEKAVNKVKEIIDSQGQEGAGLRIYIAGGGCSGFKYGMAVDTEPAADDKVYEYGDLKVFVDSMSLPHLQGCHVDYVDDALLGQGFKIDNPNAVSTCGCGSSFKTG